MRPARRSKPGPAAAGSSWTCVAADADGSSWTNEAHEQRGSSWTRTAAILRGSSWTRDAAAVRGSSWTRDAQPARGSSWTRDAQPVRGSSWTRALPRTVVAGLAALAMGAVGAPAYAATTSAPVAAPQPDSTWLVRTDAAHLAAVQREVARLGGSVVNTMTTVSILQVRLAASQVAKLTHTAGVRGISRDGAVKMMASEYDAATDTLAATTAAVGLRGATSKATGAGVDVALVDSGVAPVKGLQGANKVIYGPDLSFESQNAKTRYLDTFGHGTHLAGIIAGNDGGSSASSFKGVAPDARILSVKVADAQGNSDVSQVIAGVDWVVEHAHDKKAGLNVRVLNLSFGTDADVSYLRDPLAQAVEVAWHRGIVVVVSAGNQGSALGHLTDPAINPWVLAVAAGDNHGGVAAFSSIGDGTRNPDVTAPGSHIPSLRVPGSFIDSLYGDTATDPTDDRLIRGSGTSQAAAFVSGMVADMLQVNPSMTPDEAKFRLRNTATPLNALPNAAGAGLVNARALDDSALDAATDATPDVTAGDASDTSTASIAPLAPTPNVSKKAAANSDVAQSFARSTGDGSLNASRGHYILVNGQVALTGEQDIFSHAWDSKALANQRAAGNIWKNGRYNGSAWGGSAWGGSAWGTGTWNGSAWGGSAWGGSAWGGSAWGGSAWGGSAWGGSAWGGSAWGSVLWN